MGGLSIEKKFVPKQYSLKCVQVGQELELGAVGSPCLVTVSVLSGGATDRRRCPPESAVALVAARGEPFRHRARHAHSELARRQAQRVLIWRTQRLVAQAGSQFTATQQISMIFLPLDTSSCISLQDALLAAFAQLQPSCTSCCAWVGLGRSRWARGHLPDGFFVGGHSFYYSCLFVSQEEMSSEGKWGQRELTG